jgi:hypothetical protein
MCRLFGLIALFCITACRVEGHYVPFDGPPDSPPEITASWLKHVHGSGREGVSAIAFTADGGVLISGLFEQTIDLGGGPLAASGVDLYIAKYSANGDHIWSRNWSSPGFAEDFIAQHWKAKLRPLSNGDFILAGEFYKILTLGGTTLHGLGFEDIFIARFSNEGEPIWARSGGSNDSDGIGDLSVDPDDNIAICGNMLESGAFFGGPPLSGEYGWLARITGTGDYSWSRAMPAAYIAGLCGVASMSDGDVVYAGSFAGTVSAGGRSLTSQGEADIYMARYGAADGAHRWSAAKGGSKYDEALDVETSGSSIVVVGGVSSRISFGGPFLIAQASDAFVAKFGAEAGSYEFSLLMGGPSDDRAERIAVRADGQWTISGDFAETAKFGETSLSGGGDFVVDLDGPTGAVTSARSVGSTIYNLDTSSRCLVVGGHFTSPFTALNQTLTPDGEADGYVLAIKR